MNAPDRLLVPPADALTVIRDPHRPLGKRFVLNADGRIEKHPQVAPSFLYAKMLHVPDTAALADLLRKVGEDEHLAIINSRFLGVEVGERFIILSEAEIGRRYGLEGRAQTAGVHQVEGDAEGATKALGRLKENVLPSAWQILDRDMDEHTPAPLAAMGYDAWIDQVEKLLPGVAECDRLRAFSSSSRVLLDGKPVGGGNGHTWVRMQNADDVERLRGLLPFRAMDAGLSWQKPRHSRSTGEVVGHSPATILDPSVWSRGRVIFVGKPVVEGKGLTVCAQHVETHEGLLGPVLPTDTLKLPPPERLREITAAAGMDIQIRATASGLAVDSYDLALSTEIEIHGRGVMTVSEAAEILPAGGKLRCQAPFRASDSWAGVLGRGADGKVFVFDSGTHTTHWLNNADATASDFDALPSPSPEEAAESEAARQRNAEQQADDARIAALAVLSLVDYERQREEAAEELGVRVSILDKLVLAQRPAGDSDAAGDAVMFPELDPWPDPVDGATLLDDVAAAVRRYIVLPAHADTALTLWAMFTHAIDAVGVAPILLLKSAEKRCGKTTAMSLVQRLARRALPASNITAPALFRSIEAWAPTLLIDEADTFLKESPELNGIINSGHTRPTAFVIRTVGEDFEPRKFSTWGAKAIASIGGQSGTLHDRSIVVELKRRLPGEHVEKLRHADDGLFEQLLRRIVRFVGDNIDAIRASRPELPATLNDRAADNWEPLLAVAAVAGGHWPTKARRAALALSGAQEDGKSIGQELLEDIREIFAQLGEEKIGSADLLGLLCGDDEKMWATFNRGRSITPKQISQRLREFKVQSKDVRIGGSVIKGYERRQFDDAFARYLPAATPSDSPATPADLPATALQPNAGAGFGVAGG